MPLIDPGKKAPAFALNDQHGRTHRLSDYAGRPVVLYFYPKDDTPGCVKEACEFRDSLNSISRTGAIVLGVSRDDAASHQKFKEKYGLNFPLLVDPGDVSDAYGTWVEKNLYGRTYMGIQRATFLIGPDGNIARAWPKVKPEGHAQEVLDALKQLSPSAKAT